MDARLPRIWTGLPPTGPEDDDGRPAPSEALAGGNCGSITAARGQRNIAQILHGIERILRRLRSDAVFHAVLRIEIEGRRGLKAAAGRHQQALHHVALGKARALRHGAIHVHGEIRIVEALLDAHVRSAGHILHLIEQPLGKREVALLVGSNDLDVDGRGQAEVENLRHHVHRQGVELGAGKTPWQTRRAAAPHILRWDGDAR